MYFSLAGSIIASAGASAPVQIWYYKDGSAYGDARDHYWSNTSHWWSNPDGTGTHPSVAPWTDATYLDYDLAYATGANFIEADTVISSAGTGSFTFTGFVNGMYINATGNIATGTYIGDGVYNNYIGAVVSGGNFNLSAFFNGGGTVSGGNYNLVTTFNNSGGTVSNTNSPIKGAATFVSGGYCAGGFGGFPFDGPGCTDANYCNYATGATWSDGSCLGLKKCVDTAYCNYTSSVGAPDCPDNTVCAGVAGCTNPAYCNYNPSAACDDGSCAGTPGCTNPAYCNYNPSAACDDGSCSGTVGCTNSSYCNYDAFAACDSFPSSCAGYVGVDC